MPAVGSWFRFPAESAEHHHHHHDDDGGRALDELFRGDREHGPWGAGGRPQEPVDKKVLVEVCRQGLLVADRRHPSDGIAGAGSHELGARLLDRTSDDPGQASLVDPVSSRCQNQDRAVLLDRAESRLAERNNVLAVST